MDEFIMQFVACHSACPVKKCWSFEKDWSELLWGRHCLSSNLIRKPCVVKQVVNYTIHSLDYVVDKYYNSAGPELILVGVPW